MRIFLFYLPGMGKTGEFTQMDCSGNENEPEYLDLEGQEEGRRYTDSLSSPLAGVVCGLAGYACWNWGPGIRLL